MNSALSTELKSQQKVREKGQHVMIFHSKVEICIAVSCRFSLLLLSFLPPVRTPASQVGGGKPWEKGHTWPTRDVNQR